MQTINYKIHLILHSKYKLFYHFTIIFLIYCMFYGDKLIYCMIEDNNDFRNKFYIYWPGDADNIIDKDVEYYALKDDYSRSLLSRHRENVSLQKGYFNYFVQEEYEQYRLLNGRNPYTLHCRMFHPQLHSSSSIGKANLENFLTRNNKPFVELDYSGLKINKQTWVDNRGKMIREVSTNTHPCDCFSMTKRYIDVYYPSYHPDNGFKPHSEVNRHLVETTSGCNIS